MSETKPASSKPAAAAAKPKKVIPRVSKSGEPKSKPESRSARAGITFPVSRVDRLLREGRFAPRVESTAPVYLAAVLEYLVFEILELAHNTCSISKKTRITPQHINWAVGNDLELNSLFQHVTIAYGGVLPTPQQSTGEKKKKSTKKATEGSSQIY
ncbi:hypothetical protein ACTFIZ_005825 [Dictyostelium cf. discoideum]